MAAGVGVVEGNGIQKGEGVVGLSFVQSHADGNLSLSGWSKAHADGNSGHYETGCFGGPPC